MAVAEKTEKVEKIAGSGHVTVACKVGVAWLDLQLCERKVIQENTQTGPRDVTQYVRVGGVVRIRGTAYPNGQVPEGFPARPEMVMGYALTPNVPRAFWEQWVEQHKLAPYVMSGMIFAFDSVADIRSRAKDYEKDASGFEPLQRGRNEEGGEAIVDPRVPKPTMPGITVSSGRAA